MIKTCPKCAAMMEPGFVIDRGDYNAPELSTWHPGEAQRRWWGLKIDKNARHEIISFRCTKCGFLEDYAP